MHKMSRLIELFMAPTMSGHFVPGGWRPAVDVYRFQRGWLLKFDLAGVSPDDVQVRVEGRHVTISGVRRDWRVHDWQEAHQLEIAYSRFERSIEFPEVIDQAKILTEYRDGIFLVHLEVT